MADVLPLKSPPPVLPANSKDEEIIERRTLRDYYIILRERVWIALPISLLVAIGLGYYQSRETPIDVRILSATRTPHATAAA